jgi:O-acetylserine dependent cystathionine beta-synthase
MIKGVENVMGIIYEGIHDLIGNTPIMRLKSFSSHANILAKLEFFNPGGSVKDRLGVALIKEGERTGKLKPRGTVIEPTAGNTGIGLALAAIGTSYRVICVVPSKFSMEKQETMRALGATVINTPTDEGIKGAIAKANSLAEEIPNSYVPQQFHNPANPIVHYETTGPEIWEQTGGKVDIFVAGAGSSGTYMGAARYLKEQNPNIRCVIVEPQGSIIGGGRSGPHKTEGIGMEFFPPFFEHSYIDEVYTVEDVNSFAMVNKLAEQEGLLVGSSAGAACYAAVQEESNAAKNANIVVLFADGSDRYLSKKIFQGGE